MTKYHKGPIEKYQWGIFVINGIEHSESEANGIRGKGKDIRVCGDTVTEWVERKGHTLSIDMITGIFDQNVEILIIGRGAEKALKCPKKVRKDIEGKGIKVVLESTQKACKIYNKYYNKGARVALLAHGTC